MEQMVTQGLVDLGWQKEKRFGRWTHHLSPIGFVFDDVLDNKE